MPGSTLRKKRAARGPSRSPRFRQERSRRPPPYRDVAREVPTPKNRTVSPRTHTAPFGNHRRCAVPRPQGRIGGRDHGNRRRCGNPDEAHHIQPTSAHAGSRGRDANSSPARRGPAMRRRSGWKADSTLKHSRSRHTPYAVRRLWHTECAYYNLSYSPIIPLMPLTSTLLGARSAVAPGPQPAAEQQAVDGHATGAELPHTFQIGQVHAEIGPLGR
jgi:hypothetical protein